MPEITTVVVGTKFRGQVAVTAVGQMRPGDVVRLVRETNEKVLKHDLNAVQCHFLGTMVGFVPQVANWQIAQALDRGGVFPICTVQQAATVRPARGSGAPYVAVEPKIVIAWRDP